MKFKAFASLFFAVFVFSSSAASAFNITRLLGRYPEFSTFNDMLTQTKLYEKINRRQTITVLALDNSSVGDITGKPEEVLQRILSAHIILDYYDISKLHDLSKKSTLLTTLYQASGTADNQQGFLNVTRLAGGDTVFGSAVKGASLNAKLVKAVAAMPYNISVLQVSCPIIAPGVDPANPNGIVTVTTPPPAPPAATPKKAPTSSPAKAPVTADTPESSEAPVAEEPAADAPADAPEADSPASSPPAPGPVSDEEADAPASANSSSSLVASQVGVGILMGLLSAIMA
ncbi:FAS1 domain-containing protein [Psidium guajava]|nr:FAS1 domain-containing protein [Psidium guajava]